MNMYKKAAMQNLTFTSSHGEVFTADLFQMPMTGTFSLDAVGIKLQEKIEKEGKSLVDKPVNAADKLRLKIVTDVIQTRKDAIEKSKLSAAQAQRRRDLHKALEVKKVDELSEMSIEEIEAELAKKSWGY